MMKMNRANDAFTKIMMKELQRSVESPVYCRYCGLNIKEPTKASSDSDWKEYLEWEIQNRAHVKCARNAFYQR